MTEKLMECTAILGWGSLIHEPGEEFKSQIKQWVHDGPILPIEFSRVSSSRIGALTLVIDPDNGAPVKTWYVLSTRLDPEDAVCDLRTREETVIRCIGLMDTRTEFCRSNWTFVADKIRLWLYEKGFRAVVWTDLPSNYTDFTPNKALEYLKQLTPESQRAARQYIKLIPPEVKTPLRSIVSNDSWFDDEEATGE